MNTNKKKKPRTARIIGNVFIVNCSLLVTVCLLFVNCDVEGTISNNQYIEYDLRGTWEWEREIENNITGEKETLVSVLELEQKTIKITGPVAHLQGFTPNTVLEAYTEDNNLYINDRGAWQSPITYTLWKSASSPPDKFVTLKGGGSADETFKLISNSY
jgi:hypothetical protein